MHKCRLDNALSLALSTAQAAVAAAVAADAAFNADESAVNRICRCGHAMEKHAIAAHLIAVNATRAAYEAEDAYVALLASAPDPRGARPRLARDLVKAATAAVEALACLAQRPLAPMHDPTHEIDQLLAGCRTCGKDASGCVYCQECADLLPEYDFCLDDKNFDAAR